MIKSKKVLAIIPARGGSKGVLRKNIKLLAGKPLIKYAIESAQKSKYFDKIVVSTDDKEIIEISKESGVLVIKRPKRLATDSSPIMDSIRHVLDFLKNKDKYVSDFVVILQPTSPLRTTETINLAIEKFFKNHRNYDSLVPLFPLEIKTGKVINNIYQPKYKLGVNRQELQKVYKECGTIFILKTNFVNIKKDFGRKIFPFIIKDHKESIDIDTEDDFKKAEHFLIS
jgi:N-acylneuraminate cytidylyltransferase/CMP-N,N'-diacetyllegionaminic acid synthase